MRLVVTVDVTGEQLENGPLVGGPASPIEYPSVAEAGEVARALVAGGTVKGAYVQQLRPVAYFMPVKDDVLQVGPLEEEETRGGFS